MEPLSWLLAETLSLNTGPVSRIVAPIRHKKMGNRVQVEYQGFPLCIFVADRLQDNILST